MTQKMPVQMQQDVKGLLEFFGNKSEVTVNVIGPIFISTRGESVEQRQTINVQAIKLQSGKGERRLMSKKYLELSKDAGKFYKEVGAGKHEYCRKKLLTT